MQAENIFVLAPQTRRPDRQSPRRIHTPGQARRLGALILDSKGMVRFCSPALARFAGFDRAGMAGIHARSLIPALPFNPATEGYNVAFAAFTAARRSVEHWTLRSADGRSLQVTGSLTVMRMDSGFAFCVELGDCAVDTTSTDRRNPALPARRAAASTGKRLQRHWPAFQSSMRPLHRPRLDGTSRVANGGGIHVTLDRQYRIGFASSAIEELLGLNYEQLIGIPISVLLPELALVLASARTVKSARLNLQETGSFRSHARHADGRAIPVTVSLKKGGSESSIPLLLKVSRE